MRKPPTVKAPINVFMVAPHESIKAGITSFPAGWVTARISDSRAPTIRDCTSSSFRPAVAVDPAPHRCRIGQIHVPRRLIHAHAALLPRTAWNAMKARSAMQRFSGSTEGQEHGAGRIAGTAHLHLGSRPPVVVEPLLVLVHPPALAVLDDHDVGRPLGERNQFHFDWLPVDRRRLRPHGDRAAGPIGLRCSHRHGLNRLGRSRLWPTPRCTEKRERVQCGRMSYG